MHWFFLFTLFLLWIWSDLFVFGCFFMGCTLKEYTYVHSTISRFLASWLAVCCIRTVGVKLGAYESLISLESFCYNKKHLQTSCRQLSNSLYQSILYIYLTDMLRLCLLSRGVTFHSENQNTVQPWVGLSVHQAVCAADCGLDQILKLHSSFFKINASNVLLSQGTSRESSPGVSFCSVLLSICQSVSVTAAVTCSAAQTADRHI